MTILAEEETMKESDRTRRKLVLAGLGGLAAQLDASGAVAQDPVKVMPRAYRVAFENDQVRVLDFIGRPGMGICGEGMHSHPAHLTIVMTDWQGVVSTPDTAAKARQRKFGDVFWSEAETHKVENTGKTSSRVLIVELKAPAKTKA
jgi:beta-alanine degradation protein BauB